MTTIVKMLFGSHLYGTPLSLDQTISVLDNDHLKLTATVENTEQFRWWLLGFGERVEIIAPAQLRETMTMTANALYEMYNKE